MGSCDAAKRIRRIRQLEGHAGQASRRGVFPAGRIAKLLQSEAPPARVAHARSSARRDRALPDAASKPCGFAEQRADHTQMRDDGQPSTRVRVDEFGHDREGALLDLSQVLTATGPHFEVPSIEAPQGIAGRALDLVARQALPVADVEFAQLRVPLRPKTPRLPEDRGGLGCASKIARDEYVDGVAGELESERVRLLSASIGERWVSVSLPATRRVPARLGVPDQQQ